MGKHGDILGRTNQFLRGELGWCVDDEDDDDGEGSFLIVLAITEATAANEVRPDIPKGGTAPVAAAARMDDESNKDGSKYGKGGGFPKMGGIIMENC